MSDTTTPSSRWAADGQRDPHGDRYACERAALALGNLTDDELANAVFLHGNEQPTMADMAAGKALAGIVYLTAAKDRIRWLSRRLAAATTPQPAELAEQQVDALRERTPADFAIEHAGYLANASTRLLKACGELDSLVMRRDEHDDVDDSDMHAAQDRVDEASDSVRSAIYEFEKRRDRALAATGKQQVGEVQGDVLSVLEQLAQVNRHCHNRFQDYDGPADCAVQAAIAALAARQTGAQTFQAHVSDWMGQCFLPSLYSNMIERGDRLLEEVLELLQAHGYDQGRIATLVQYVYGRPVGEPAQEVGGVMVTLAGYCWVAGLDMHAAGDAELQRITQPEVMDKIRRKQEAKNALHFDTPLPGHAAPPAQALDLGQFRTQVAELLRMEFDLEVADPEDHRHDDGASEAERIAAKIAALIDQRYAAPGPRISQGTHDSSGVGNG